MTYCKIKYKKRFVLFESSIYHFSTVIKKNEELKEGDFVKVLWSNKTYPALVRLIEKFSIQQLKFRN